MLQTRPASAPIYPSVPEGGNKPLRGDPIRAECYRFRDFARVEMFNDHLEERR